ncbi:MAG: hypothetical protein SGARI_003748 [Bacillariaceae sp.]
MTEQHQLPNDRARTVSSAMGQAFTEAAGGARTKSHHQPPKAKKDRLAKYASMIDRAFAVESSNNSHQQHSDDDDLVRTCQEQEEELMFLRAALKHLVLHEHKGVKIDKPELEDEIPSNGEKVGIPNHIEINRSPVADCLPFSEESSELTPSEGDFLEMPFPPRQPPRLLSGCNEAVVAPSTKTHSLPQYPQLEKGQVKGQHARCLDFFMYLNDLQTLLQGKYSGKISLDTGLPHGKGVFRFDNGDFYVGDFLNGMMHGAGCLFTRRRQKLLKLREQ